LGGIDATSILCKANRHGRVAPPGLWCLAIFPLNAGQDADSHSAVSLGAPVSPETTWSGRARGTCHRAINSD